jgi:hypothetical protein
MSLTGNALADLRGGFGSDARRKLGVWVKGHVIFGYDPVVWRRDDFGNAISYSDYGDRNSKFGWEIDHIIPVGLFGTDDLSNLRPLHCTVNAGLGGLLGNALKR